MSHLERFDHLAPRRATTASPSSWRGLGGAAAAGSPAVACFVGGTMADAAAITEQMALISAGRSTRFKLPT